VSVFVDTSGLLAILDALVQKRLGLKAVKSLDENIVPILEIVWMDAVAHRAAVSSVLKAATATATTTPPSSGYAPRTRRGFARGAQNARQAHRLGRSASARGNSASRATRRKDAAMTIIHTGLRAGGSAAIPP
jgi:hypothetical protein